MLMRFQKDQLQHTRKGDFPIADHPERKPIVRPLAGGMAFQEVTHMEGSGSSSTMTEEDRKLANASLSHLRWPATLMIAGGLLLILGAPALLWLSLEQSAKIRKNGGAGILQRPSLAVCYEALTGPYGFRHVV